jgi:DnaJ-class molecular chaperone
VEDPYKTLGVAKDAKPEEIRQAYRKLAKKYHPDLNPGDKSAEEKFKSASAANELLSDPDKRARFDRGEIDASGAEQPQQQSYRHYAEAAAGERYGNPFSGGSFEDIFGDAFRSAGTRPGNTRMRGHDEHYALAVEFLDAVNGATRRLTLPDGRTLDVKVPPGLESGQILRLRGQGGSGWNNGPAGDALIEVTVNPHPFFRRDGQTIRLDLPVTIGEAVLGGRITVPTPRGAVAMTVPPRSDTGTEMRLRGRGVPAHGGEAAGDLYVTLRVVIGTPDAALETFLREHKPEQQIDPRAGMLEAA